MQQFKPNETVLTEGAARETVVWYVIASGTATMTCSATSRKNTGEQQGGDDVIELFRGDTFGERSILLGKQSAEVTVKAGSDGLFCLCFQAETLAALGPMNTDLEQIKTQSLDNYASEKMKSSKLRDSTLSYATVVDPAELETVCFLGCGGFGLVVLQEHHRTRRRYALKRMSKGLITDQNAEKHICQERDLMSLLDSPFVVHLYSSYKDDQFLYIVLDAMLGGNLDDARREKKECFEADDPPGFATQFYVACVTEAIDYLHSRNMAFRDLKPENVLLDERGYAKLCDMGFARLILGRTHTMLGTPDYMAPEIIDPHRLKSGYTVAVDWWALGVMSYELLTGHIPFSCNDIIDDVLVMLKSMSRGPPASGYPARIPAPARAFTKQLLEMEDTARLGSRGDGGELKQHEWLKGFDFNSLCTQCMEPPYKPEEFKPRGPAPEFWREDGEPVKVVVEERWSKMIAEGGNKETKKMTKMQAVVHLQHVCKFSAEDDDWSKGVTFQNGVSVDDSVSANFKSASQCDYLETKEGWTSILSHADLFRHYDHETYSLTGDRQWDRTFERPAAVKLAHENRDELHDSPSKFRASFGKSGTGSLAAGRSCPRLG
jgi:cGMP-dependent protein kinase